MTLTPDDIVSLHVGRLVRAAASFDEALEQTRTDFQHCIRFIAIREAFSEGKEAPDRQLVIDVDVESRDQHLKKLKRLAGVLGGKAWQRRIGDIEAGTRLARTLSHEFAHAPTAVPWGGSEGIAISGSELMKRVMRVHAVPDKFPTNQTFVDLRRAFAGRISWLEVH